MSSSFALRSLFVLALAGLTACGSEDPAGTGGGSSTPITQDITAAKGGSVADQDGNVVLTIPAGALGEDTKITLTVAAKEAATATSVYAFGPAGLAFEIPATLSISSSGVSVPEGKKLVMAAEDGAGWAEVPGSAPGSGTVEAPVPSLATYSLILADAAAGPCDAACLSQTGAVCCTTCGCEAEVSCAPQCPAATPWDCEIGCCFDYDALECAP